MVARARDVAADALAGRPVGLDRGYVAAASDIVGETAEHLGLEAPDLPDILERCRDLGPAAGGPEGYGHLRT